METSDETIRNLRELLAEYDAKLAVAADREAELQAEVDSLRDLTVLQRVKHRNRATAQAWLRELEGNFPPVARYMAAHRSGAALEPGTLPRDDISAATLLGLVDLLAKMEMETRATFTRYVSRSTHPPVFLTAAEFEGLKPDGFNGLLRPAPVVDIYFRDFIRSFWSRLTRKHDL